MSAYREGSTIVVGFEYHPAGHRSALRLGAGATSSVGYGHDPAGRLNAMTRELAGTGVDLGGAWLHSALAAGRKPVRARESAEGEKPDAAEGATAPESLRHKGPRT